MVPAVLYPVTADMRVFSEEQFGPVVPIAVFDREDDINDYFHDTFYGQQASVFTSSSRTAARLIDLLSVSVGRVNINTQCGRSPDRVPFSGRRSSALGAMSVTEGLLAFSIPVVVAGKDSPVNREVRRNVQSYVV